jgi:3-(3-hydroxy-phenyl)propionate hydroxylase
LDASTVHVCADDMLPDAAPEGVRVLVDVDGVINAEFGRLRGHFLLIRPDHVIAAAWRPDGEPQVATAVATWTTSGLQDP